MRKEAAIAISVVLTGTCCLLFATAFLQNLVVLCNPIQDENAFIQPASPAFATEPISQNNHASYNFTVSICAITLDDEAYLTEWIDYHLLALGFDRIFLFDNSINFELKRWHHQTRKHPIYSRVTVHHFPGKGYLDDRDEYVQGAAYADCVRIHGKNNDYLAMIDTDEYLVPRQFFTKHNSIHAVLDEYLVPYGGALVVNWMLFGTANKTTYTPLPVTKRFQLRDAKPNGVIKSIVKSDDYVRSRNPHSVQLRNDALVRTSKRPGYVQKEQFGKTGASDNELPASVILLHHYRYKSEKEHHIKRCQRGEIDESDRGCNEESGKVWTEEEMKADGYHDHLIPRPGEVQDDLAWKILLSRVPKYRTFDSDDWEDFS